MAAVMDSTANGTGGFVTKGFPVEILDFQVDSKLLCTLCKLLPRNPVQGFCGHRFCNNCIGDHLARSEDGVLCQDCVAEDQVSEESTLSKNTVFPDAACRRELNQLPVHCCYGSCDWTGLFKDFEKHCDSCPHLPLLCPVCQQMIARMQLEDHVTQHQRVAELRVNPGDQCPFNCGQQIGVEGLQSHVRDQLSVHLQSVFHRVEMMESQLGRSSGSPESVMAHLERLERQLLDLQSTLSSSPRHQRPPGVAGAAELDEITGELDMIEKVLQVLSAETTKMQEQMKTSDNSQQQQQHKAMMDSLQSLRSKADDLERRVSAHDLRMREIELKLTEVEMTSYDGTLVWKITDIARRRRDAVTTTSSSSSSSSNSSVQSPAFYTSRSGYKMFGRVYLNGDGGGKSTHLSLYLVIGRGQFDALLRWPFSQRVTMTLLDQVGGKQHVTETFRPDRSSSAFQRPTAEMNVATRAYSGRNADDVRPSSCHRRSLVLTASPP